MHPQGSSVSQPNVSTPAQLKTKWAWGEGSANKRDRCVKFEDLSSKLQHLCKKLGTVVHVCNLAQWRVETGGLLHLAD